MSLFDIQINGFAGVDFQRADLSRAALRRAIDALAAHRTPRIFLALITDSIDALAAKFARLEQHRADDPAIAAAVCGYHLEGPWLSPKPGFRGAHPAAHLRAPAPGDFRRLQEAAGGNIRLVTLAPELPGSIALIRDLAAENVAVSLGHTDASEAQIDAAINAGARFCTHLGNGIPAELPRHDNILQRLLARDELTAFFIPDGIHLPPFVLRNLVRAKPPGKTLFTTDAMAAAGAPPGRYTLGGLALEVGPDRVVRQPGAAHFAGSALAPDDGARNAARCLGWSEAEADACFGERVAAAFGFPPQPPALRR